MRNDAAPYLYLGTRRALGRRRAQALFAAIVATELLLPPPAFAATLSTQQFAALVQQCAPETPESILQAVAKVESGLDPLAINDNTAHLALHPQTLRMAVTETQRRFLSGHSLDLGLMQIHFSNLKPLGLTLNSAFDPCQSMTAGAKVLASAYAQGSTEADRQAALLITLSRYNTGKTLAGIANGYVDHVVRATANQGPSLALEAEITTKPWDIWGTSDTRWVISRDDASQFMKRAGAQTSDARNEGRAPASPSEKGEPYELSAYQESKPSKP